MSTQSVHDLIGESGGPLGLGEDMTGSLTAGYLPDRSIVHIPQMQLGDGLAGPPNDQQLQIFRDNRPIATDELGLQGPFFLPQMAIARHRAGRTFPLNYEWDGGFDPSMLERAPEMDARHLSPLSPGQLPDFHDGVPPVEVLPSPRSVYYTASPNVGWQGY